MNERLGVGMREVELVKVEKRVCTNSRLKSRWSVCERLE